MYAEMLHKDLHRLDDNLILRRFEKVFTNAQKCQYYSVSLIENLYLKVPKSFIVVWYFDGDNHKLTDLTMNTNFTKSILNYEVVVKKIKTCNYDKLKMVKNI